MIQETTFDKIEDLTKRLNQLPNKFIYRGQADASWNLQSSLERLSSGWTPQKIKDAETLSIDNFKSKYQLYCGKEHIPNTKLAWLSALQHFGAPTRLIDFTTSPYAALFFALETYNPSEKKEFAVFAIDCTELMNASVEFLKNKIALFDWTRIEAQKKPDVLFDKFLDAYSYSAAWIIEPTELNSRMDRQAGTFLMSGDVTEPIEAVLSSDIYKNTDIFKFRISPKLYEGIYVALRKMNINAKTIYGDLAGLAKSIRMDIVAHG